MLNKINVTMKTQEISVKEMGDDPKYYAVVVDPAVPSSWMLPMFDGENVAESIDRLSYTSSPYQAKLLPEQRKEAIARLRARIPELNIEDEAKAQLLRRLDYCEQAMMNPDSATMPMMEITSESTKKETLVIEYDSGFGGGTESGKKIATAEDVNIQELTAGDPDPVYINLPIAKVNAVSGNGLLYDKALVTSIKEQIVAKKPGGIFGHISDEDRATKFPIPNVHWIGAEMFDDELWAKGYVPAGEAANYVRRLKAAKAGISTSIYGTGVFMEAETVTSKRRLKDFILEQLDFAPPARASLKLGGNFHLTREMSELNNDVEKDKEMTKVVTELTANDIELIPAVVREAIIKADAEGRKTTEQIAELQSDVARKDRTISEMTVTIAEYKKRDFLSTVTALVNKAVDWATPTPEAIEIVAVTRNVLSENLKLRMGEDLDPKKAERILSEMIEGDYKTILEAQRDRAMGPQAVVGAKKESTNWRDEAVKNADKTRSEWGV